MKGTSTIYFGYPNTRQQNWTSQFTDSNSGKLISKKTKRIEPHSTPTPSPSSSPREKKSKKSKIDCSDDSDDSGDENPFKFPNLFKEGNERIYLKQNHLFFHTGVDEKSVDLVKKLMREYLTKYIKSKSNSSLSTSTPKPLFLHIYSPGGGVYAGLSLYDFITEYNKTIPVYTIVEGLAASAATIISIGGVKRFITPNSYMLIHQLSTYFGGNFEQIKDEFGNCEKLMKQLKEIYASRTKLSRKQLNEVLKRDVTWSAEDCKKYGLVDEIKLIDIFNDTDV
jgi:ATP-dependent Clp endopeptidase proteolytic subunit ClpP